MEPGGNSGTRGLVSESKYGTKETRRGLYQRVREAVKEERVGYYIQTGASKGKAEHLVRDFGGKIIPKPKWEDVPEDKAIIVVVDNIVFEEAGLAFDRREFEAFTLPTDGRPKKFVLLDKEVAYKQAGYFPAEKGVA